MLFLVMIVIPPGIIFFHPDITHVWESFTLSSGRQRDETVDGSG